MILKYILLIVVSYIILNDTIVIIENYEIRNQDINQEFENEIKERENVIEPTIKKEEIKDETKEDDKFSKNNTYNTTNENDYISQYSLVNYTTLSKNNKEYEKLYDFDTKVFNHKIKTSIPKYLFYL